MKVTIPRSVNAAVNALNGIDSLLTAKGWERAAIVAAFVEPSDTGGRSTNIGTSSRLGTVEFAGLGIAGLTSPTTVLRYVTLWLEVNDGKHPVPGRTITLPDGPFPPEGRNLGSRTTVESIRRDVAAKPELARAAAAGLVDGGVEHLDRSGARDLDHATQRRRVRDIEAEDKPRRIADRHKTDAELADETYWDRVRAALHLLLDVKVKIAAGYTVPGDISILMQILVPEQDWDEALRTEIGSLG